MEDIYSVGLPDTNTYTMCMGCGKKIEKQNILDHDKIQFCFYCNRRKIQRF